MGTWAAPQTAEEAERLQRVMRKPIRAKHAAALIFNIVGDDSFWDIADAVSFMDGECDLRCLVAWKLDVWVKEIDTGKVYWRNPWEDEAVSICRELTKEYTDSVEESRMVDMLNARVLLRAIGEIENE